MSPEYAIGVEPVAGAFATTPILLLALSAPVLLVLRRSIAREQTMLASVLLLSGALVFIVPVLTFDGATMRYEMDFVSLLLFSALLVGLRLQDEPSRGAVVPPRRAGRHRGLRRPWWRCRSPSPSR